MAKRVIKKDPEGAKIPLATEVSSHSKPAVFISHDSRDADLAEAFANLLTDVSGGILKPFCSSDKKGTRGIEFGEEWFKIIMSKLNESTDVVALLTQYSLDRPWILYEAGVAKGKFATPVFGVAIGIPLDKASTGPFAQFQNCGDDSDSLTKLALQLIRRNPEASPREEAVRRHVDAFLENIQKMLKKRGSVPQTEGNPKLDESKIAKLFEEVKVMFRSLPDVMEEKLARSVRKSGGIRERVIHPLMVEDMLMYTMKTQSPGMGVLIAISLLRDDLPWLYEIGLSLYKALETRKSSLIMPAMGRMRNGIEMTMHSQLRTAVSSETAHLLEVLQRSLNYIAHELPHNEYEQQTLDIEGPHSAKKSGK